MGGLLLSARVPAYAKVSEPLEYSITPQNAELRFQKKNDPASFFFGDNQFEILLRPDAFPVRWKGKTRIILRMPSNQDSQCRAIGEKLLEVLTKKSGEVRVKIDVKPYARKMGEELELQHPNVFFALKRGRCDSASVSAVEQTIPLMPKVSWLPVEERPEGRLLRSKPISIQEFNSKITSEFRKFYEGHYLRARGWQEDVNLMADGPASSQWGYRLNSRVVVLSYETKPLKESDEPGIQCPCELTFSILESKEK